ncbi:beta-ketoacyl synthase N-terminal-like domain-containing protein, partial [Actinosynnema sp. NPDC023658]|uniref:beta-ketoacyl synthase N-terminal-like domain-containing protein n=1 Tax=Actinosynnema sp. NPDC023658 TaxID=3155465 RepID=UPI0033C0457F
QLSTGEQSTRDDPRRAYLPFDADANGFVPGEGGAILVLEDVTSARARGARSVYGVVEGCASTFDPKPGSGRPPGLRRAVELALADAGRSPAEVDVVFADAHGTPELDRAEAEAITAVFGPRGVPVTAPKTMTGRLCSGGAPLDLVAAVLSIRDGVVPPTVNVTDVPGGYGLDLVLGGPREVPVRTAVVLARGHRGFNSALVVSAP